MGYGYAAKKSEGAFGMLKKTIANVDVVLHLVDSRFPNPSKKVEQLCKEHGKALIIVLTKADLSPEFKFPQTKFPFCEFSTKQPGKYRAPLLKLIYSTNQGKRKDLVRVAVVGYPNVGKSSLINTLSHRKSLSVSPEAGHTKSVQWIKMGRILLSDTPGVIPERLEKAKLVIMGSLNIEKEDDPVGVCEKFLAEMFGEHRGREKFMEHYDIKNTPENLVGMKTPLGAIELVAKRRGRIMKGGEPNLVEAARIIVSEWQKGKLRL